MAAQTGRRRGGGGHKSRGTPGNDCPSVGLGDHYICVTVNRAVRPVHASSRRSRQRAWADIAAPLIGAAAVGGGSCWLPPDRDSSPRSARDGSIRLDVHDACHSRRHALGSSSG